MNLGRLTKCLIAVIWLAAIHPATSQVVVSRKTTIAIGRQEPLALKKAAADLASDMQKVFGAPVRVVHLQADAGPSTIVISSTAFRSRNGGAGAHTPEILQIRVLSTDSKQRAVLLTGSDLRGAIFAVYQFSQQFLGVDPMYFWTDVSPTQKEQVVVPADFFLQDGPPTFTHRGLFINDEDLLTGWRPGTKDGADISLEIWDKIFETILRLKGDMVVPGTFLFPDEPQIRLAQARGLIVSQSLVNTFRWPADKPYSFTSHPELLISAWKHSIESCCPGQDTIWTLGYRGLSDRPFWADDPSAGTTDAEHAAAIQSAIAAEMKVLKEENRTGPMIMNAWMEMVSLLDKNLLHIPEGVTLVWPDDGRGNLRDHGKIREGQGVYFHTAVYDALSNQLTEAVPVERIQHELGRAAAAGATNYLLINTSDIRPVVMTTQAAMELGWNAKPWLANSQQSNLFLENWARDHYGAMAAQIMAEYYRAYFDAPGPFELARPPLYPYRDSTHLFLEDNAYHYFARYLLVHLIKGSDTTAPLGDTTSIEQFVAMLERSTAEAEPRWEQVQALAQKANPLISPQGRELFQAHVLTQLGVQLNGNLMLREICEVEQAQTPAERLVHLEKAITFTEAALQSLHDAEFGKWIGFYKGDIMVNVRQTLALEQGYRDLLEGRPLPKDLVVATYPTPPYDMIKAYQGQRTVSTY